MNPLLLLEGEIFVLQKHRNWRQHAIFSHPDEVGPEPEGKQVVRQLGRDDRFEIFEFDLRRLKDVCVQLQAIERVHPRGIA